MDESRGGGVGGWSDLNPIATSAVTRTLSNLRSGIIDFHPSSYDSAIKYASSLAACPGTINRFLGIGKAFHDVILSPQKI